MFKDTMAGILSYFKSISLITKLGLWGYFVIQGLVSFVILLVLIGVILYTYDGVGAWIANLWPFEWGSGFMKKMAGALYSLFIVLIAGSMYKYLVIICMGPFLSPMSEKIEYSINQRKYPPNTMADNAKLIWRGLSVALALITYELLFTVPLYIMMLIPGTAFILAPIIFCISAYYAGRGNMDFVLERRYGISPSLRVSSKYGWLAFGNGLIYMLLVATVIGAFFAPILSVAGLSEDLVKRLDAEQEVREEEDYV